MQGREWEKTQESTLTDYESSIELNESFPLPATINSFFNPESWLKMRLFEYLITLDNPQMQMIIMINFAGDCTASSVWLDRNPSLIFALWGFLFSDLSRLDNSFLLQKRLSKPIQIAMDNIVLASSD